MKSVLKRVLAALIVLSMGLTAMVACDKPVDPANAAADAQEILESKEYRDTYKTYFSTSYSSLNYFSTSYATVREIVTNCIDGLVEPDVYGNYVASLAESWEHNDDYTVWTFKIREGLKWVDHTGAETEYALTAEDFVDGIKYIGDPLNGAYSLRVVRNLIAGLYDYYWGLDDIDCGLDTETNRADLEASFSDIVGVKALDEYTVQYTLESSAPYFLSLIESSMLLLPVEYEYAMALGEDFGVDNTKMLYCGPYYVSEFKRDKLIKLTKNENYWDADKVTLNTVEYQMIPDGTTSLEMFQRGELDYTSVETEAYQSLQNGEWADNLIPNEFSFSTNYLWLDFSGANPEYNTFVQNENFRKALQHAVNRTSLGALREPVDPARLVRNTINAEGAIFNSEGVDYTQLEPLANVTNADYSKDPAAARTYMEAAIAELCNEDGTIKGVSAGTVDYLPVIKTEVDGKLPVTLIYVGTDDEDEIILAQLFEAMVEEAIGKDYIDVELAFDTSGDFYGTVGGSVDGPFNYDIYWDSLSTGYADPSGILGRITTEGVENVGAYNVPEYDALVEKALSAETFDERLEYFAQAEAFLLEGAYMIPVISSLRGYHMSYEIPFTGPRCLYGNVRYKGVKVATEALTMDEYEVLEAAWTAGKNK
ncbi:MAG: peptide ABC transporter substrate-binding protein [Clostridia bacterium]|nr:peptide ABC transporter substrate-binding protein [Clostridia bacterium]